MDVVYWLPVAVVFDGCAFTAFSNLRAVTLLARLYGNDGAHHTFVNVG